MRIATPSLTQVESTMDITSIGRAADVLGNIKIAFMDEDVSFDTQLIDKILDATGTAFEYQTKMDEGETISFDEHRFLNSVRREVLNVRVELEKRFSSLTLSERDGRCIMNIATLMVWCDALANTVGYIMCNALAA